MMNWSVDPSVRMPTWPLSIPTQRISRFANGAIIQEMRRVELSAELPSCLCCREVSEGLGKIINEWQHNSMQSPQIRELQETHLLGRSKNLPNVCLHIAQQSVDELEGEDEEDDLGTVIDGGLVSIEDEAE